MTNSNEKKYNKYEIVTDNGSFCIYCGQDLNLYWVPCLEKEDLSKNSYEYVITEDDVFLCKVFDELYNCAVNKKDTSLEEYALVKDGVIEWHSDDFSYDAGSILSIEKDENANYHVTFTRSKNTADDISMFYTYAVQMNWANSRYGVYAESFVDMYGDLKKNEEFPNNLLYILGLNGRKRVRTR